MLTFEEFFAKKKIDLALLEKAEPALFSEFKSEFEQMGEKSFDHTKKFWFNKIRRAYHVIEGPKPAKTVVEITEIASQAEFLSSPTIVQKPVDPQSAQPGLQESEQLPKPGLSKPAFKPRFKPGLTTNAPPDQKSSNTLHEQPATQSDQQAHGTSTGNVAASREKESTGESNTGIKPGYKPRFKAQNMNSLNEEADKGTSPQLPEPLKDAKKEEQKPLYKPRFNARLANSKPESETDNN